MAQQAYEQYGANQVLVTIDARMDECILAICRGKSAVGFWRVYGLAAHYCRTSLFAGASGDAISRDEYTFLAGKKDQWEPAGGRMLY